MQQVRWIRYGLASIVACGSAGALTAVGCGGDDNGPAANPDTGAEHQGLPEASGDDGGNEGGPTDGGGDGEAGPKNAFVHIVHASPDAPPVRVCFGLGNGADGGSVNILSYPAAPDDDTVSQALGLPFPGLYPGTGGTVDDHGFDLSSITVSAYAINAAKIAAEVKSNANEAKCDKLIGAKATGGTLTPGTDFWYLGTITKGTLTKGSTWIAAVTGCLPGDVSPKAVACPTGYNPANGNLGFNLWQVDNASAVDGGNLGAQFIHASSGYQNLTGGIGGVATTAGFLMVTDAGLMPMPFVFDSKFGDLKPATVSQTMDVDNTTLFFAQAISADASAVGSAVAYPLPIITQLTYGPSVPEGGAFANGQSFTFILLGTPGPIESMYLDDAGNPSDAGRFNGRFIHFLGFPNANLHP